MDSNTPIPPESTIPLPSLAVRDQGSECSCQILDKGQLVSDFYPIYLQEFIFYCLNNRYPNQILNAKSMDRQYKKKKIWQNKRFYTTQKCSRGNYHIVSLKCQRQAPMMIRTLQMLKNLHKSHIGYHQISASAGKSLIYHPNQVRTYCYKYVKSCSYCSKRMLDATPTMKAYNRDIFIDMNQAANEHLDLKEIHDFCHIKLDYQHCPYDCTKDQYSGEYAILFNLFTQQINMKELSFNFNQKKKYQKQLRCSKIIRCSRGTPHLWKLRNNSIKSINNMSDEQLYKYLRRLPLDYQKEVIARQLHGQNHRAKGRMLNALIKTRFMYIPMKKYIEEQFTFCEQCKGHNMSILSLGDKKKIVKQMITQVQLQGQRQQQDEQQQNWNEMDSEYRPYNHKIVQNQIQSAGYDVKQEDQNQNISQDYVSESINNCYIPTKKKERSSSQIINTINRFEKQKQIKMNQKGFKSKFGEFYNQSFRNKEKNYGDQLTGDQRIISEINRNSNGLIVKYQKYKDFQLKAIVISTPSLQSNYFFYADCLYFEHIQGFFSLSSGWLTYILSGITPSGKCTIFGFILICDTSFQSFFYALKGFFEIMHEEYPRTIYTNSHENLNQAISSLSYYSRDERLRNMKHIITRKQMTKQMLSFNQKSKQLSKFWSNILNTQSETQFKRFYHIIYQHLEENDKIQWLKSIDSKCFNRRIGPYFYGVAFQQKRENVMIRQIKQGFPFDLKLEIFLRKISQIKNDTRIPHNLNYDELHELQLMLPDHIFLEICKNYLESFQIQSLEFISTQEVNVITKKDTWSLKYSIEDQHWSCNCFMLERRGIPCSHLIRVLFNFRGSLRYYINSRWVINCY